jgi:hypothetical protein
MFRNCMIGAILLALMLTLQIGCSSSGGGGNGPTPTPPVRLVAQVHQDPTLASIDSPVWDSITATTVPVGADSTYNANVLFRTDFKAYMKALVANDSLFIRVTWADNSQDNRFGRIQASWNGINVEWTVTDTTVFANEDRFSILIDKGGTNHANCALMCHSVSDTTTAGHRFYGAVGDNADMWEWKASRTGLANRSDDMHMTTIDVSSDPHTGTLDQLYFSNFDTFLGQPGFMDVDSNAYTGPGLLESRAPSHTFVPYSRLQPPTGSSWVNFTPNPPVGLFVPGYYIYDVSGLHGSRWDVRTISSFDGSNWTLVFCRALYTGDTDDKDFRHATPDSTLISIAISNNSGIKHYGVKPFYLVLQ